ncbi:MAG: hypothetical protein NZ960_00350 [Candidatus Kapabacteria bacterium]|nr:hypothetical protein [Candidatus Kapabacteria bacterium]MDW8011477.1 hypothetical protein [Bacteroidota bacterium]
MLFLLAAPISAQSPVVHSPEVYALVRLKAPPSILFPLLWDLGADEHSLRWTAQGIEAILPSWSIQELRHRGIPAEAIIPDLEAYYEDRLLSSPPAERSDTDPVHF